MNWAIRLENYLFGPFEKPAGPRSRGGVRGGDSPLRRGVRGSANSMPDLHALRPEASADLMDLCLTSVGG